MQLIPDFKKKLLFNILKIEYQKKSLTVPMFYNAYVADSKFLHMNLKRL